MSNPTPADNTKPFLARLIGAAIVVSAVLIALAVWHDTNRYPRTDDAWVLANLIGFAPEVGGRIIKLNVSDNQFVKAGVPLFEIDPLPYQYALQRAQSEQAMLEGQIANEQRVIAGQRSGVNSAQASVATSEANVNSAEANINAARASVSRAEAAVKSAEAEQKMATDTVNRLEPLLTKHYVTPDQVERARTQQSITEQAASQARAQFAAAEAQLEAALAQANQAKSNTRQSQAQLTQSIQGVTTMQPLIAQRAGREAAVLKAQYDLQRCQVYAPFDAWVTNMNISEGAYAHVGETVFTLIDARKWYVIGNFRESQLNAIRNGMPVDVYVMSQPNRRFDGVVESANHGVTPQEVSMAGGLPSVQRSLNWVHLATRIPVRVRVKNPPQDLFRIGESAVVIVRGDR